MRPPCHKHLIRSFPKGWPIAAVTHTLCQGPAEGSESLCKKLLKLSCGKKNKETGKRWKKESIEKQNSIDVIHMHHTMLWQDALLLSGLCFILIALVVIAWQLTVGLYSSLPFITKYYNMFTISPGIAIQSPDQYWGLKHITYNSFILVRMCLHSLH